MRIHVNPASDRLRSFAEHLPELFENGGEVLHTGRNTIKAFDVGGGYRVAVKRFRRPNLFQAFVYTFFRRSKARRSYEHAVRLRALGIDTTIHDIRFVEDNWENPTLGAWGLGWEIWMDGMEVTQFTYFQQVGGLACKPITGEITYGLERLCMYLQNCDNVFDLVYTRWGEEQNRRTLTYGDVFHQNEVEQSKFTFEYSDASKLLKLFDYFESEAKRLMDLQLALPAYEHVLKAGHTFNLLDARGAISVTERAHYISRIRSISRSVAQSYYDSRERLGFPMLKKNSQKEEA